MCLSMQNEEARKHVIPEKVAVFAITQPKFVRYQNSPNAYHNKLQWKQNSVVLPLVSAKYIWH